MATRLLRTRSACVHGEVLGVAKAVPQGSHGRPITRRVTASPSNETNVGRSILEKDPDNTGSLGTAISEAVEEAVSDPKAAAMF